jgi:hypothetical protein
MERSDDVCDQVDKKIVRHENMPAKEQAQYPWSDYCSDNHNPNDSRRQLRFCVARAKHFPPFEACGSMRQNNIPSNPSRQPCYKVLSHLQTDMRL